ncbi:hypothetical protein DW085_06250 [Clostridium sp. AF50-3]|uniref:MFS transporter n=1 Tax=unclassified Clostridium TaxID=2614128 RepID=UPI000E47C516|nr:MFS transporter [Clostridium sp. AF50-3]RHO67987.1 hypothetical protein DW085_06250 [Clostridium sp. AF50-3]RHO93135.1 hypothetical protein DW023_01900 [Clostridium sp. AF37-7]RHP61017.1 hypothetical protein DWZ16_00415 [Clostridium sp. AF29-8BH]RHQ87258.1 hypothetical protein DWX91_03570 [Clostridium sp. AF22-10]
MESLFSDADSFISYDDSISHPASGYQAWQSSKERGGREKSFVCSGVSAIGKKRRFLFCLTISTLYWFSHRPVGSFLSLIIAERGGDAELFGNVCGIGAAVEFLSLLLLAYIGKKKTYPALWGMAAALGTNLLRPICFQLFSGEWSLYLGQILQSVSFALYMSASVECFAETSDERLKSFSISIGLTISSVIGTVCANMAGGKLCDLFYPEFLILFSFLLGSMNLLFFILVFLKERLDNKKMQC